MTESKSHPQNPNNTPVEVDLEKAEGESMLVDVVYDVFEDSEACEEMRNPRPIDPRRK